MMRVSDRKGSSQMSGRMELTGSLAKELCGPLVDVGWTPHASSGALVRLGS